MIYNLTNDFIKINETTGTIQNTSSIYSLEMSLSNVKDSGILLFPLSKVSFTNKEIYLRCYDGAGAEARVIPFETDAKGGDGTSIVDGVLVIGSAPSTIDGALWLEMED